MYLKVLHLRNFRNYASFKVGFSDGINIICAKNGIGKTNLLEAISLLSTGKSFRTLNLKELIQHKKSYFCIEAEIYLKNISQIIKIYYDGKVKKITYNSNTYPSFTSLLGVMPSILQSPDDINLIKGKPQIRRKFLNLYLAQADPLYVHHYLRFTKALKQRNHLLKTNKAHLLKSFDTILCRSGAYLSWRRKTFLDEMQNPLNDALKKLSKIINNPKLSYISSILVEKDLEKTYETYLKNLQKNKKKDLDFKTTLIGPHRDDFSINIENKTAKNFASEGQKKMLLYAMRFAEWSLLFSKYEQKPLFLVDDFDAHLDENHLNSLKNEFNNFSQVFITMPRENRHFERACLITLDKKAVYK